VINYVEAVKLIGLEDEGFKVRNRLLSLSTTTTTHSFPPRSSDKTEGRRERRDSTENKAIPQIPRSSEFGPFADEVHLSSCSFRRPLFLREASSFLGVCVRRTLSAAAAVAVVALAGAGTRNFTRR